MWIRVGNLVAAAWLIAGPAAAQSKAPANDDCLACHGDASATRDDGRSIAVDSTHFDASAHGPLACVDCHQDLAAAAEFPHASKLRAVDCAACHDAAKAKYATGVHGRSHEKGQMLAATCADCHGTHDILPAANRLSRTNHLNLPSTCGKCHGNLDVIRRGNIEIGDVATKYHDSIHGRGVEKAGLIVSANCSDCHGNHDIRPRTDPESSVFRTRIPDTCGKCHDGVKAQYDRGVHGTLVKNGSPLAPVCVDCHTAHQITRVDGDAWRLEVIRECGTCHEQSMRTYRDTFHGQVTALGFTRVAACSDCHGSHEIHRASDARSTVSSARIVSTCQKCHADATASFAKYDPHADPHNRNRNPLLFYAARFMSGLLIAVFGFFGIHTTFWLGRSVHDRQR